MTRPTTIAELGRGVFALIDPDPHYGRSNLGCVVDADGLTIFDTGPTPAWATAARDTIIGLTQHLELPIKRVALSTSRIVHSGGGSAFWASAFYGTDLTSDQLDAPPNPDAFRRLLPEFAPSYDDAFATRPITHTVSDAAWLTASSKLHPVVGESAANLVLKLEAANVVFAGAVASFGVTPLCYDGYPLEWAVALEDLANGNPTIVPGHGQPGGAVDLADQAGYLRAVIAAEGDPEAIETGPWDTWTDRRFDTVNVERAVTLSQGIDQVPQSMFSLLGLA